jgi:hypothetical protein
MEFKMINERLRLIEVCDIKDIPDKFHDIYKTVVFFQEQMSSDKMFSEGDIGMFLNDKYYLLLKEFMEYGVQNNFIQEGDKPLSRLSVKMR